MTTPLRVLALSSDRDLLRRLSWLLADFGCQPTASADLERAVDLVELIRPHAVLLDCPAAQALELAGGMQGTYVLLLTDDPQFDVGAAIEAGVDDCLRKPPSNVEVLTRLRVAARSRLFDEYHETNADIDPHSELLTRAGLINQLHRQVRAGDCGPIPCVCMEFDVIEQVVGSQRAESLQDLTRGWAKQLGHDLPTVAVAAHTGEHRFCIALPGAKPEDAVHLVESLRERLAAWEHEVPLSIPLTASFGIGCHDDPRMLVEEAEEAVRQAKFRGGDCCVQSSDSDPELAAWKKRLGEGNPFVGGTAADAMTPFSLWAHETDRIEELAEKLRSAEVPVLPVLDESDQFVGLLLSEDVEQLSRDAGTGDIRDLVLRECERVQQDTDFTQIMAHFFAGDQLPVAVMADERPRGVITRKTLVSLVAPLRYSPAESTPLANPRRIAVPDLDPADTTGGTTLDDVVQLMSKIMS